MDSAQIARDGVARIEKRYWFGAETKRRFAAVETLDQLSQEAGGSAPDLGKLIRAAAQRVPESGLTQAYRDGLARVGQMTAAEAAAPVSLMAAVALATAPDSSVPGLDEVVRQTSDPVATAVRDERLGRDGLRLLADLPRERDELLRQTSAQSNRAVQRALLGSLDDPRAQKLHVWSGAAEVPIRPGVERMLRRGSLLEVAADTLREMKSEDRCELDLDGVLPASWQALSERLGSVAGSKRGDVLMAVVTVAVSAETDDLPARLRLAEQLACSPALTGEMSALLREACDATQKASLNEWGRLAARMQLEPAEILRGERDILASSDPPLQVAALYATEPAKARVVWGERLSTCTDPVQKAFLGSLEPLLAIDPRTTLEAASSPVESLEDANHRLENFDAEDRRVATAAWSGLATTPNDQAMLAVIGTCKHQGVLAQGLRFLGQEGITPLTLALKQRDDFAQAVEDVTAYVPAGWAPLLTSLGSQAGDLRETVQRCVLEQASEHSEAGLAERRALVNELEDRVSEVPDRLSDQLFVMLRDACDGEQKQRLEEWAVLSRKLKMTGGELLSGARRLLDEEGVVPAACAAEQVARGDNVEAFRALLDDARAGARTRGDLRESAYLDALVAGADRCQTEESYRHVLRSALEMVQQGSSFATFPEALGRLSELGSSLDAYERREVLAGALAVAGPLAETDVQRQQLDILTFAAGRMAQDPDGSSTSLFRGLEDLTYERDHEGDPVAALAYRTFEECESHLDRLAIEQHALALLQKSPDESVKSAATLLASTGSGLSAEAHQRLLGRGIKLLGEQPISGASLVRNLDWPSPQAHLAAGRLVGSELKASRDMNARAAGGFLDRYGQLPFSSEEQQAEGLSECLDVNGDSSAYNSTLELLQAMGQSALRRCSFGQEKQGVAEACLLALGESALSQRDPTQAGLASLMARMVATPLVREDDRRTLAEHTVASLSDHGSLTVECLTRLVTMACDELSEGGLAAVSETLLGALEETGDTKLLVPLATKAREKLEAAAGLDEARQALSQLCEDLDRYCKGDFWSMLAPKTDVSIEERPDALIVGGVRVAKKNET